MRALRSIAASFVLLSFSIAAKAFVIPYLLLGVAVALTVSFGMIYDYFAKAVVTPAHGTIKVLMKARDGADPNAIMAANSSVPSTATLVALGPFTHTVSCPDAYCKRSSPVTFSAATVEDLLFALNMCPSDVCQYGGNINFYFSPTQRNLYTGYTSAAAAGGFTAVLSFGTGQYATATVKARGMSCPAGYTYNTGSYKCDLTDPALARTDSAFDGVCPIFGSTTDGRDPDCAYLGDSGLMTTSVSPEGSKVFSVADPNGDKSSVSFIKRNDGSSMLSQTKPLADGGTRREDTEISSSGAIGPTSTVNYPANPIPPYPGAPSGTPVPGSTGTGTTATTGMCGTKDTAACSVSINSEGHGDAELPLAPGDLPLVADFLSPVKTKLSDFLDFKFPSHSSSCPVLRIDFDAWGLNVHTSSNFVCDTLESHRELFSSLAVFGYLASAIFIILGA